MGAGGVNLRPLRETCVPRDDVLEGGLTDNHFAAQLDKIVRNPADYPVYGDAGSFFAITYPTAGLHTLLSKAFGRVTGAKGTLGENGVLRPTTTFGGGKTHGLAAVYHLAIGARPDNVSEFIDPTLLPDGPVQVVALVGDALDPVAGVQTNGQRTYTLWGEMAAQIGAHAYGVLEANDRERSAPGTHTIVDAFGGQPTIVIIDEIAQYLRQVTSAGSEDVRRMAQAVPVFLKNLFEVAADASNKVVVIVTLASTSNAYGKETDEIAALMDADTEAASGALAEAADVLARSVQPSAVIQPADDAEIGEILKRRLFQDIDASAAREAADAYKGLYEGLLSQHETLAGGAEHPASYTDLVAKYYPFHPELVRVLDKRLGDIPQFQRARGALKLLGEVVHHVYADGDTTPVINVADLDYRDAPVLNHLTVGIGRPEFESVAKADVAGAGSHAAAVDNDVFHGTEPYAARVASTVFTHSLEMKVTAGASRNDWILGTLRPGESPAVIERALQESEKRFWHLSFDGARWRFNVEPNVNAIIETEKRNIQNTRVAAEVDTMIKSAYANDGGATTIIFPAGPADIADITGLRIAVLDHDVLTVTPATAEDTPTMLADLRDKAGAAGLPRKYRNGLVFAVADSTLVDAMKDRVRALIAADVLAADQTRLAQFGDEVRKKIDLFQKNARLEARIAITRCYKHVYYPVKDQTHEHLRHRELPTQEQGSTKTATSAVLTLLRDEGKIRSEPFTASFLKSRTWPDTEPAKVTQDIADWFWVDHGSPIVQDVSLIRAAIIAGVKNDGWVYYDAAIGKAYTASTMAGLSPQFGADKEVMSLDEANKRGLIVRKPTQHDLKQVFTGPIVTAADLRAKLDTICGGEPTKADVLDVLATAVQAHDYGWIVVTDAPAAPGVRALTPSGIKDKGLDALTVMTRDYAEANGVEIPTKTISKKTFTATGPGGAAIQSIIDQVTDFTVTTVARLTIKTSADDVRGTGDLDLLATALGMLPKPVMTVTIDVVAEFPGVSGGLRFQGSANRADFQTLYGHLGKSLKAATAVSGSLTLDITYAPPVTTDSGEFVPVAKVIKDLQIQHTDITAEVTT